MGIDIGSRICVCVGMLLGEEKVKTDRGGGYLRVWSFLPRDGFSLLCHFCQRNAKWR